jgi:formamidopyrimidine-DNA glycosylase
MPELPEVEVLRRSLEPRLVGERLAEVEVRETRLREPVSRRPLEALEGARVEALGRRAKYLLVHLGAEGETPRTLVIHLGMSGRLTLAPAAAPAEPHEHLVFRLASGRKLRFCDPRRFGLVFTVPTTELAADRHFAHLGVEPLEEGFSGAVLRRLAQGRRGPVKGLLMDATAVVGLGNIYATEALFRAGIHPRRSAARIGAGRWERLGTEVVAVLNDALAEGGTTLNDFADGEGRSGYFQVSLAVYGREGEPCFRCGRAIRRIVQAGRSTFYCPGCQR